MAPEKSNRSKALSPSKSSRAGRSKSWRLLVKVWEVLAESFPKLAKLLVFARGWTRKKPPWQRLSLYVVLIGAAAIYGMSDMLLQLPVVHGLREQVVESVQDVFAVPLPKA